MYREIIWAFELFMQLLENVESISMCFARQQKFISQLVQCFLHFVFYTLKNLLKLNKISKVYHSWTPHLLYKERFEFLNFSKKEGGGGGSDFYQKNGKTGKVRGYFRKGKLSLSLIFIVTLANLISYRMSSGFHFACLHYSCQYSLYFMGRI